MPPSAGILLDLARTTKILSLPFFAGPKQTVARQSQLNIGRPCRAIDRATRSNPPCALGFRSYRIEQTATASRFGLAACDPKRRTVPAIPASAGFSRPATRKRHRGCPCRVGRKKPRLGTNIPGAGRVESIRRPKFLESARRARPPFPVRRLNQETEFSQALLDTQSIPAAANFKLRLVIGRSRLLGRDDRRRRCRLVGLWSRSIGCLNIREGCCRANRVCFSPDWRRQALWKGSRGR
jgi:hypothetical protein